MNENYLRVNNIIKYALGIDSSKKAKSWWYAYITALLDFEVISQSDYSKLRDYIECAR